MKKTLLIATLAALTSLSSFGQGYFSLAGAARSSWDIFTPANGNVPKLGATMNIGILWGLGSAVSGLGAAPVTNNPTVYVQNPWLAIQADMTSGNWHLAVDNNTAA